MITLIHPGTPRIIYGSLSDDLTAIEPPTWCRMIAGWLRDRGYEAKIIDQEAEGLTASQVAVSVAATEPQLIAIVVSGHQPSASTQQMPAAREVAKAVKGIAPTLLLGNHPSALPFQTLAEEPVNYVCDGEGPLTIKGLLDGNTEVRGLSWLESNGDGHYVSPATLIPIDDLHGDVWDLLPMGKYRAHTWQCLDGSPRTPYASIYTTLGCPFKCSFCMINVFQHSNRYRMRTPIRVVEQIEHLYRTYGVTTLKIADEMFVLNERHYTAICEGLAARRFADELNIWAYARIDTIKPDKLKLLRQAGIKWLALGIESGSAHVRDGAEKSLTDQDIREAVAAVQKAGINVIGNFIFGLPDDTFSSMSDTLNLAKSLDLEFANFYSAMAYPGSKLFDQTDPKDLPESWSGYSQHSYDCTPLPTETLSSADVLSFRDRAFMDFFTDPRYLDRIEDKFGAAAEIELMTRTTLPRKLLEDYHGDHLHHDLGRRAGFPNDNRLCAD